MTPAAAGLVPRMREVLRMQMHTSVADGIQSLLNDMLELGSRAQTNEDHQLIVQALDHVDRNRRALAEGLERHLLAIYDEKIGWLSGPDAGAPAPRAFGQFDLLDEGVLAQQLALKKLVQKTLEELDKGELAGVEVRLRELFGTLVDGARNPVGPGTVLKAAQRASAEGLEDGAVQATLINVLQPHLAAGLRALYVQLNELLIGAGIRPDYRPAIERDASGRHAARQSAAGISISQVMSLRDLLPDRASTPLDLKEILAALLAGSAANRQYGARLLADPEGHLYASAIDTPANDALLGRLQALQHVPAAVAPGTAALRTVVEHMGGAEDHPLDQLTAELVTVVFDFLLADRALPDSVKQELGRLQIVALKAALLDRSFFARREHPLRILLDEIVAVGADPSLDTGALAPFVHGLHAIVDDLVAQFEADLAMFETAAARLREVVAEAAEEDERALAATTAALLSEEREAHARQLATDTLAARLNTQTPDFLRDFLQRHWTLVLADARLQHAADEEVWQARLRTADALIASMRPRARHEIPAFVATLPALVREVQAGMRAIGVAPEAAQAFMNALMEVHTGIMQMRQVPAAAPFAAPEPLPKPATDIATPATPLAFAPQPATDRWQRGALVEFVSGESIVRGKLVWVSPARTRYLFNMGAGQSRVMTDAELSRELAGGGVRLLQLQGSSLDRALAATVGDAVPNVP
jgi:hypothetical protein